MTWKFQYSVGIILSYIFLLIAIFVFDWGLVNLYVSLAIEFAMMTLAYAIVNTFFNRTIKTKAWTVTILFIGYAMLNLQLAFISLAAEHLNEVRDTDSFIGQFLNLEVLLILIVAFSVYLVQIYHRFSITRSMNFVADNYFKNAFSLYGITSLAILAVFLFQITNISVIACVVVLSRILMEVLLNHDEKDSFKES